jgi:hypothetical protein
MFRHNTAQLYILAFECGTIYIRLLLTCVMTYLVSDKKGQESYSRVF